MNFVRTTWVAAALATLALTSHATVIVGGSDLLDAAYTQQLTDWLGEGSVTLTNIFDKVEGSTSYDFHAAVDGKGATFSVFEATSGSTGETFIVGGFDPQSWSSIDAWNYSPDVGERTAFIFNLSSGVVLDQFKGEGQYNGDPGIYQTYNGANFGPIFGGGLDLKVDYSLVRGYSYTYSYGESEGKSILGTISENHNYNIGQLEVFRSSKTR